MIKISSRFNRSIYLWCLALTGISLPLSIFALSVVQITMTINWILEKPLIQRWHLLKKNTSLLFIIMFYIVHILGLLHTIDLNYGFHELKTKLPLLLFPVIIATSDPLDKKWLDKILYLFVCSVTLATFYSTFQIIKLKTDVIGSLIKISPFISHTRLALMVNSSAFISGWFAFYSSGRWARIGNIVLVAWLINFLFLLQSFTGIAILFGVVTVLIIVAAVKSRNLIFRWTLVVFLLTGMLLITSYFTHIYVAYFSPLPIDTSKLERYTIKGNEYWHDPKSEYLENGNYTYLYICDKELSKEWELRSKIKFEGTDKKGQQLKYVIYRYLTSKDLRKDSAGLAQLKEEDIKNIENGIPNVIYTQKYGLKVRLYQIFWELYHYKLGSNPTGYSVSQRIEFTKAAIGIIKRHFWFGTGTGDVVNEFNRQYELDNSSLGEKNRGHAHNNFLTFFISFGLSGFIVILLSLFVPPFIEKKYNNYLFGTFFIISVLSMLVENTLGTHTGISYFAFFYALFLYSRPKQEAFI